MINGENSTYKFCAKVVDEDNYIVAKAIRFEGNGEFICAIYYDDWAEALIKKPIYRATSLENFKETLIVISQFYTKNPEGVLDFTS